jgi:peptide/nickel transport system substrate-binding protein
VIVFRRMRVGALIAVTGALALTFAACGGGDSDSSSEEGSPAQRGGTPVPAIRMLGPSPAYDPGQNEALKVVQEGMQELGLTVEFEGVPDFGTFDEQARQHEFDIGSTGYLGTLPRLEPTELMGPAFLCANVDGTNYSGYCNEEFDSLFQTAVAESDPATRKEAIDEAQVLLSQDLPMVVKYYPVVSTIYNKEQLSNPTFVPASGYFNFWTFENAEPADGTMTVGIAEPGQSMNPMCNAAYFQESEYQLLVWDPLTRVGPDGQAENWLAENIERPDDTTIVVTIRDGVSFSDGSPLTAEDVAFTFNYYKRWEVPRFVNQTANLEKVSVTGDNEVTFKLAEPNGALEFSLLSAVGILPKKIWNNVTERENVKTPCDWESPEYVGSGPYKFVSYDPNQALRLERNDDHFQPPKAREFVGRYFATQQSLFLDMRAGNTDMHDADPGFTPSQIEQAESDGHLEVRREPSTTVRFFIFNLRAGSPFEDYALRKAVAEVVDYDTIVAGILHNEGVPGAGIIAPANEAWHNDAVEFPPYDVEAARATLEEAGYTWDGSDKLVAPDREPQLLAAG